MTRGNPVGNWQDNNSGALESQYINMLFTILEECPVPFMILDSRFQAIMCNKSAYTIFGCRTQKEYLDHIMTLSPPVQPDGAPSAEKYFEYASQSYKSGKKVFHWTHLDMQGTPLPFRITMIRVEAPDPYGGNYMIGFLDDMRSVTREREQGIRSQVPMEALLDATPLCLNLWNTNLENIMCNKKAVELFELSCGQEYLDRFFDLSPVIQPNGMASRDFAVQKITEAFETGFCRFNWLHWNLKGEEIPAEITLVRIDASDNNGQDLVAGFTRDLRPQLAGNDKTESFEDYFFNYISDKMLFKAIMALSNELFFALDLRTSLIQYYGKGRELFGFITGNYRFPDEIIDANLIYPDDIPLFKKLSQNMKQGIYEPIDLRFVFINGTAHYYRVNYQTFYNQKNEPVFSIGKAVDIHEQKELEFRSTVDLLTNCLNKVTTEESIEKILLGEKEGSHALFMIDIDDFKAVNDTFGHHFGDLVLCEVADHLRNCFCSQDIIGRIGGDEFIVFVKNVSDPRVLTDQAQKIAQTFQTIYSGEKQTYKISGSIGIARFPEDGGSYEELYKAADKALYQSKNKGKDCYTFYRKDFSEEGSGSHTIMENAARMVHSYYDAAMVSSAFNLLYETQDMRPTINAVLQLVGKQMKVDRCYIFETFDQGDNYNKTHEWCAYKEISGINEIVAMKKQMARHFFQLSNREGIVCGSDLSCIKNKEAYRLMADQGVKAFLQVQIREKDYTKIIFGVDNCSGPRSWNEMEINTMLHIARLIATFLLISSKNRK